MATESQLQVAKRELEAGKLPFMVVREQQWELRPVELRRALLETYGEATIQPLLQTARQQLAGQRGGAGQAGFAASRLVQRLVQVTTSRPELTVEQVEAVIAELENAIVQLNVKKAELEG